MKQALFLFSLTLFCFYDLSAQQDLASSRLKTIGSGINVSWLEQTWNSGGLYHKKLNQEDFNLLASAGIRTIRLPVAFERFYLSGNDEEKNAIISNIDNVLKLCQRFAFKLILVNHSGRLQNQSLNEDEERLKMLWAMLEKKYRHVSSSLLYFELFNEPTLEDAKWLPIAASVTKLIHQSSPKRTLIIGASNYNSIYELSRISPLLDKNIIYTFHFYEPFIFTHQGATWIGKQVTTTGIPFPYAADKMPKLNTEAKGTAGEKNYLNYANEGKKGAVHDKLMIIKNWSKKNGVPILCSEYGVYRKHASFISVCNYLSIVKNELQSLAIPGIIWDYDDNFSILAGEPKNKKLLPCLFL